MSRSITIAELLRGYPKGTKLYSPVLGKLTLAGVSDTDKFPIVVTYADDRSAAFMADGRYVNVDDAECCIFPSYEIRNWNFLLWKKGYVVEDTKTGRVAMFEGWADDEYRSFKARWTMRNGILTNGITLPTSPYFPCDADKTKRFVRKLEKMKNGKFNPDTLEVEPDKPECPFKPFDKVLVRDSGDEHWQPALFSWKLKNEEYCYGVAGGIDEPVFYRQCIPYNEETAHLVGTTDPYTEFKVAHADENEEV